MARPRSASPAYQFHISGQAVVRLAGVDFYLGPHDTPESWARYFALLAEYNANGRNAPDRSTHQKDTPITVTQVTAEFRSRELTRYPEGTGHHYRLKNLCTLLEDE